MSEQRNCPGRHIEDRSLRDDEYLCMGCLRHAERILGDLPALVAEVETTVARQAHAYRAGGMRRTVVDEDWRGTAHALAPHPLPVDIEASTRARTTLELLFEWADFVAEHHGKTGLPMFSRSKPLTDLTPAAVAILLRYADWMRSNEQGPALAEAVRCVRRDIRTLIDCRPENLYAGPCRADLEYPPELGYRCEAKLYREWGRAEISCDSCGTAHTTAERREWLRAEVETRLLPLRIVWEDLYELVPGFELDWPTVKRWTQPREQRIPIKDKSGQPRYDKRGRPMVRITLTPARLEHQNRVGDVLLYRGSDILRLAEDKGIRRGRRRIRRSDVA